MFIAKITNYFGRGCEIKYCGDLFKKNLTSCRLGKYRLLIEQHVTNISREKIKSQMFHTTTLEIKGVKSFTEGVNVAKDICSLLSFASMSQVVAYEFEYKKYKERRSFVAQALVFRPVLDTNDGKSIQKYLESTWINYRKLKRKRRLRKSPYFCESSFWASQPKFAAKA